ncbi:MAG: methylmalonyl-CoA mutase subunit beta [Aequorivita sp.]
MSDFLFDGFDEVSAKQWKQKIQYDLKGLDYNETLVWQSAEGINVKPFYHADDFPQPFQTIPGQPKSWEIAQQVFIDDEVIANGIAVDSLNRGAQAIIFSADKEFDIETVFKNFPFKTASIYFNFSFLSEKFYRELIGFLSTKKATVFYNVDIIGKLSRSGNWFQNEKQDFEILNNIISENSSQNILAVDALGYQNAGANMVQQLAYALAHANEYLNRFGNNIEKLSFKLATGSNYFFEIAKIRALRKLYAALAREYGLNENCHILSIPTKRNKTLYDYNVNLLRTTTESMSAVLGGADAVCNLAYDVLYHKSNEFGERIARNQLLILKHESYLDAVSNPSDGAYYIERLTDELAEKALQLFKEIEKSGGFLHQLKEGTIQKKIKESAEHEQHLFDNGKLKLLGTNYHPNKNDRMKEDLELFPFVRTNPVKTLIAPIVERRLSEKTEQDRLKTES